MYLLRQRKEATKPLHIDSIPAREMAKVTKGHAYGGATLAKIKIAQIIGTIHTIAVKTAR